MFFHDQCFICPCRTLIQSDCRDYIDKCLASGIDSVYLACGAIYRKSGDPEVVPGSDCYLKKILNKEKA